MAVLRKFAWDFFDHPNFPLAHKDPEPDLPEEPGTPSGRQHRMTFGDQKGVVDFLINSVFDYGSCGLPRNGFFVDLAAGDGVGLSNTYFLEKYLGWRGILIEPNPGFLDNIREKRVCPVETAPIGARDGEVIAFRIDNGYLGGVVSEFADNSQAIRGKELKSATLLNLKTKTLATVLSEQRAPSLIDFLSLDVEGYEETVLAVFPFDDYKFRCMTVERPSPQLDLLLDEKGYRQVAHIRYDVIYVHKDFLDAVNFQPNLKFAFTPKKDW